MSDLEEKILEAEKTVDQILSVAQALLDSSKGSFNQEKLEKLQNSQDELIKVFIAQEAEFFEETVLTSQERRELPHWCRLEEKLQYFQKLNNSFIDNFKVRKGLINFEIQEVKETQKQLKKVRSKYVGKTSKSEKISKNINTLS